MSPCIIHEDVNYFYIFSSFFKKGICKLKTRKRKMVNSILEQPSKQYLLRAVMDYSHMLDKSQV